MLKLVPEEFKATSLSLGPVDSLDLQLGDRKSGLEVQAIATSEHSVTILLKLKVMIDDSTGMAVDFAALFGVAEADNAEFKVNDDVLQNTFIQVNAPAIAYPFLRAYVSTISVNSGYNQVLLPPVNFQAIFDKRKKKEELASTIKVR